MIVIQIRGGLGNQFFVYAAAYAAARDSKSELMIDLQLYQTFYKLRGYELNCFQIGEHPLLMKRSFGSGKIAVKCYNKVHDLLLKQKYHAEFIKEQREFEYQELRIDPNRNYYLYGSYWQNYQYFDRYREDLKRMFRLKTLPELLKRPEVEQIRSGNYTAVHVRRSDYKTFQGGKCLSVDYYRDTAQKMQELLPQGIRFLIFTDDAEFCREQFSFLKNAVIVSDLLPDLTDVEEFAVMTMCSNFILANSSFSWWAAYLSEEENSRVIAPVVDMWKESFYLPEWRKIPASLESGEENS